MDWFLYDRNLHHEKVKSITPHYYWENLEKNNALLPCEKNGSFILNYPQSHRSDDLKLYLENLNKFEYGWTCLAAPEDLISASDFFFLRVLSTCKKIGNICDDSL